MENEDIMSMGRGNTIVEFFSEDIEFSVWKRNFLLALTGAQGFTMFVYAICLCGTILSQSLNLHHLSGADIIENFKQTSSQPKGKPWKIKLDRGSIRSSPKMVLDLFWTRIWNFGPKWDTSLTHWDTEPLPLDHDGLPHVLDLAVHLVIFLACWVERDHPKTLLLLVLFY